MEGWQRWIIALVLKISECKSSEGSNPSPSSKRCGVTVSIGGSNPLDLGSIPKRRCQLNILRGRVIKYDGFI